MTEWQLLGWGNLLLVMHKPVMEEYIHRIRPRLEYLLIGECLDQPIVQCLGGWEGI